jgi:hypothetical protein
MQPAINAEHQATMLRAWLPAAVRTDQRRDSVERLELDWADHRRRRGSLRARHRHQRPDVGRRKLGQEGRRLGQ